MSFFRRFRPDAYTVIILVLMLAFVWVFYDLAVDLHQGMRTHKADLGQIDQAVWNSSRGRFLEQTDNGYLATRMTDHVEPLLVLISPVFWLWNDVRALLLLQVVFVAAGAWLVYLLAMRQFETFLAPEARTRIWELEPLHAQTRPLALALALAFLLTPQLQSAVLTEFHAAPLAVPLILWAFWAVDAQRWGQFVSAALLTAAVKEEMALLAAGLGVWALWRTWYAARSSTRGYVAGALVLVLSLAWFVIATFVIVPAHAAVVYGVAESGYFQRYGALGDSPVDIVKSFFTQPQLVWQIATEPARMDYLLGLLAPFGFLALLAPEILLLSLPLLLANLLSAYPAQYYGEFHYSAPLVAYVAAAAAYGTGRLWRWMAARTAQTSGSFQHMPAAGAGTMAAASVFTNARTALRPLLTWLLVLWIVAWAGTTYVNYGRGPFAARHDPTPVTAHHRLLTRFVDQLPRDAAVTATAAVHPHVSHRRYVYQFPLGLDAEDGHLGNAEWALLDVTTNTDMAPGDLKARVDALLAADWGVVDGADGFLLLRKGAPDKEIPAAFYDFVRTPNAATGEPTAPLQLTDAHVDDWPRWRQSKVVGTWHVGPDFDAATHAPSLDIVTPSGDVVGSALTPTPPGLVWYPPEAWQAGDAIRVTSLPFYLPKSFGLVTTNDVRPALADGMQGADGARLLAAYTRGARDRLATLPTHAIPTDDARGAIAATFQDGQGTAISVRGVVDGPGIWPGKTVAVPLAWHGAPAWPAGIDVFVHLRDGDGNVAQNDGRPRYFVTYAADGAALPAGGADDRRQLTVPPDARLDGDYHVVIGLYVPQTGARLDVVAPDGTPLGQELTIATLRPTAPPVPDQACALIPDTCGAQ